MSEELDIEVYAKLESLNPGGSHKARIALAMVLEAERCGVLVRGSGQTIMEPTGGNTGLGLAMACNVFGYRLLLVIPDNYSVEKQALLRLYGATIVLSDSRRGNNSHGEKAMKLQLLHPEYVMLNQQRNPANPETHRINTAKEISDDFFDAPLDYFVSGIGTGGHITGIGETLKRERPELRIVGVEPEECDLLADRHAPHGIQGLSIGLIPRTLNVDVIDEMISVSLDECIARARHTLRYDAVSVGLSSAANLVAIAKLRTRIPTGSTVLTMVYDGAEPYLDQLKTDVSDVSSSTSESSEAHQLDR